MIKCVFFDRDDTLTRNSKERIAYDLLKLIEYEKVYRYVLQA